MKLYRESKLLSLETLHYEDTQYTMWDEKWKITSSCKRYVENTTIRYDMIQYNTIQYNTALFYYASHTLQKLVSRLGVGKHITLQ